MAGKRRRPGYSRRTNTKKARCNSECERDVVPGAESHLRKALQCFHDSSAPPSISERDAERDNILQFVEDNAGADRSVAMLICGKPGTGKTALIEELRRKLGCEGGGKQSVAWISLNGCHLSSGDPAQCIVEAIMCKVDGRPPEPNCDAIQYLRKLLDGRGGRKLRGKRIIVSIDELDQVGSSTCKTGISKSALERVAELFALGLHEEIDMRFIGISNSATLPTDLEEALKKFTVNFRTLLFKPYTMEQLVEILKQRNGDAQDVFEEAALTFCAKMVSSQAGDIRRALSVCRQAIGQSLTNSPALRSLPISLSALAKSTGRSSSSYMSTFQTLPQQAKLLLCLAATAENKSGGTFSVRELDLAFHSFCREEMISPISYAEYSELLGILKQSSFIRTRMGSSASEDMEPDDKVEVLIPKDELKTLAHDCIALNGLLR